jgi:aryl-phospho-beta-D-glucosidase BglC (GH1 family)
MKYILKITGLVLLISFTGVELLSQSFLKVSGKAIVNGKGENVLLRGIGLGGWMLQEPYMLQLSKVAVAQYDIKSKIADLIGKKNCDKFYDAWLKNLITETDIDSLKAWGFNSIRLPMHYNLFTLPVEEEPVPGKDTWLKTGFDLTDNLLAWCRENEIYLILDLHAAPGGQGDDKPIADVDTTKPRLWENNFNQLKTIALWKKLAYRYANEEWIGGYDLINETNYKMEGNVPLRNLFLEITSGIRSVDKNHIIFIEGNQFANDYTGLTPPWDQNMAYSFHKYWNAATIETIQKYIDMREKYSVPFWMGESGENNNNWYRSVADLLEANHIGWAWWTIKKVGSESGIMNVKRPSGYQKFIDYWSGKGEKPGIKEAKVILMELAENVKIERCEINYEVIDALLGK